MYCIFCAKRIQDERQAKNNHSLNRRIVKIQNHYYPTNVCIFHKSYYLQMSLSISIENNALFFTFSQMHEILNLAEMVRLVKLKIS